jgi:hypothetical protein
MMCDDLNAFIAELKKHDTASTQSRIEAYGLATKLTLPGGGKLGVHRPRHARPKAMRLAKAR